MSRIIEGVEKHYDNGIELEFNTLIRCYALYKLI